MGVVRNILFACLLVAGAAAMQEEVEGRCRFTSMNTEGIPEILFTAETFETITGFETLYLKAWDPNEYEASEMICPRLTFTRGASEEENTYLLEYFNSNGEHVSQTGAGQYMFNANGIYFEFDEGFDGGETFMSQDNKDTARLDVLNVGPSELITKACKFVWRLFLPSMNYYTTYYWVTDPSLTVDKDCFDTKFAEEYGVPEGEMQMIDLADCQETWYDTVK